MSAPTRWLFADQLGAHFDDGGPILMVETPSMLGRGPLHRAKALLVLSAFRHRVAELGDRVEHVVAGSYDEALSDRDDLEVIDPTSWSARRYVRSVGARVLPSRGFVTDEDDFRAWADGRARLVMEDFYRDVRRRTGVLMDGPDSPAGGRWNFDADNRERPPKGRETLGLPEPWWPEEDEIDERARRDLAAWESDGRVELVGDDGPRRFAATSDEAHRMLGDFLEHRLAAFGPYEDATLEGDWVMAHSLLSPALNRGLLDPLEVVDGAAAALRADAAGIASVEGVIRQLMGWRDWVWHLYWYLGEGYDRSNELDAHRRVPAAFERLDDGAIGAACLSHAIGAVRERGWAHHIQRLMVIGNWALTHGIDPRAMNDWFVRMFVDGTEWVMPANVVGMTLHADGGIVATKPYAAGGAYVDRMTDLCGGCRYSPHRRTGDDACPFTTAYWGFLDRHEERLAHNNRMARPLANLRGLSDRAQVVDEERHRRGF